MFVACFYGGVETVACACRGIYTRQTLSVAGVENDRAVEVEYNTSGKNFYFAYFDCCNLRAHRVPDS